jgi:CxxC motif-containing protein
VREELICTICPIGCELAVEHNERKIESVEGNRCKRGIEYAEAEVFHPQRMVTTTVRIIGSEVPLLPVRTDRSVPKDMTFDVVSAASRLTVRVPVRVGEVLAKNIAGSGASLISTRNLD